MIALVLPNFTTSSEPGTLSLVQAIFFSVFTLVLYGLFLWLQTGRHRGFFRPIGQEEDLPGASALPHGSVASMSNGRHLLLLLANILPIVILAKSLAKLLDRGILALGAPTRWAAC